jgi:hypothetical protein
VLANPETEAKLQRCWRAPSPTGSRRSWLESRLIERRDCRVDRRGDPSARGAAAHRRARRTDESWSSCSPTRLWTACWSGARPPGARPARHRDARKPRTRSHRAIRARQPRARPGCRPVPRQRLLPTSSSTACSRPRSCGGSSSGSPTPQRCSKRSARAAQASQARSPTRCASARSRQTTSRSGLRGDCYGGRPGVPRPRPPPGAEPGQPWTAIDAGGRPDGP